MMSSSTQFLQSEILRTQKAISSFQDFKMKLNTIHEKYMTDTFGVEKPEKQQIIEEQVVNLGWINNRLTILELRLTYLLENQKSLKIS